MNEMRVIIDALERITTNTETRFEWEDLLSIQFDDKRAEALRQLFWQVSDIFPGEGNKCFSREGMSILKAILEALKMEHDDA